MAGLQGRDLARHDQIDIRPIGVSAFRPGAKQGGGRNLLMAAENAAQIDALVNADPVISLLEADGSIKVVIDTRTGAVARPTLDDVDEGAKFVQVACKLDGLERRD